MAIAAPIAALVGAMVVAAMVAMRRRRQQRQQLSKCGWNTLTERPDEYVSRRQASKKVKAAWAANTQQVEQSLWSEDVCAGPGSSNSQVQSLHPDETAGSESSSIAGGVALLPPSRDSLTDIDVACQAV